MIEITCSLNPSLWARWNALKVWATPSSADRLAEDTRTSGVMRGVAGKLLVPWSHSLLLRASMVSRCLGSTVRRPRVTLLAGEDTWFQASAEKENSPPLILAITAAALSSLLRAWKGALPDSMVYCKIQHVNINSSHSSQNGGHLPGSLPSSRGRRFRHSPHCSAQTLV